MSREPILGIPLISANKGLVHPKPKPFLQTPLLLPLVMNCFGCFSLTAILNCVTSSKAEKPKLQPDTTGDAQGEPDQKRYAQMLATGERQPEKGLIVCQQPSVTPPKSARWLGISAAPVFRITIKVSNNCGKAAAGKQ